MDLLYPFACCMPGLSARSKTAYAKGRPILERLPLVPDEKAQILANDIIAILQTSDNIEDFKHRVSEEVFVNSWTEQLAIAILNQFEALVRATSTASGAFKDAYDRALVEAVDFVHDHPYFSTLIAIGILAILLPWVVEVLGFGELGIIEDSFAAFWQSTYRGFVPKGSLFSYLQRLGMVWK